VPFGTIVTNNDNGLQRLVLHQRQIQRAGWSNIGEVRQPYCLLVGGFFWDMATCITCIIMQKFRVDEIQQKKPNEISWRIFEVSSGLTCVLCSKQILL